MDCEPCIEGVRVAIPYAFFGIESDRVKRRHRYAVSKTLPDARSHLHRSSGYQRFHEWPLHSLKDGGSWRPLIRPTGESISPA